MAYFNNAATTYPKPDEVYSFMDSFYRNNGVSAGRSTNKSSFSAEQIIFETRSLIQEILNCPNKQVIFEPTATIALNIIIQGVIKSGANNIYISPFEHNSVTRVLHEFEKQGKINVHQLYVDADFRFDLERIKYQFDDIKPDFVIISHASNVIGLIAPVDEIFNLAKRYDAVTLLDMAQTAGLIEFNVGSEIVDFAVFAGHKTLYGPTGISGFVMKPNFNLLPVLYGGTGYDSKNLEMPVNLPERFEIGTTNIIGVAGLNAALKWIKKQTISKISDIESKNRKRLISLLEKYWFIKILGVNDKLEYVGVVSCLIDGISSDSAGNIFEKKDVVVRTGLHCAPLAHKFLNTFPAGTIRFSVSYFTSDRDFEELKQVLDYIEENL
ncbi:cysteine desulfurase [[Clostridium] innocuum]|uniref:Cysteine desulfurase n=1 Tax=Clostridium innocuum TaxID=1522 RepID=A0A099I1L5_CLOIN|nr:aminotransferase class V-fold PLP-dependent enzyme [[Clostridium] innocuum]KGJ51436.1 cysteine desulfurase [[Clostridium] innocuum]